MHDLSANGETPRELEPPLEERIEDLRHRLRIEAAVVEGAKNVIKLLERGNKDKSDKKALQEVRKSEKYLFRCKCSSIYFCKRVDCIKTGLMLPVFGWLMDCFMNT